MNFLTRTCLSRSSLISLFLLGFWVGSSLFGIPFVKPFFCEPLFSMSILGFGLWASSGPFPLSAHYGLYKRGMDPPPPPPTNPSRHLKKERSDLPLKWLLKEGRGRSPTATATAAAAAAAMTAATPCPGHGFFTIVIATPPSSRRRRRLRTTTPPSSLVPPPPAGHPPPSSSSNLHLHLRQTSDHLPASPLLLPLHWTSSSPNPSATSPLAGHPLRTPVPPPRTFISSSPFSRIPPSPSFLAISPSHHFRSPEFSSSTPQSRHLPSSPVLQIPIPPHQFPVPHHTHPLRVHPPCYAELLPIPLPPPLDSRFLLPSKPSSPPIPAINEFLPSLLLPGEPPHHCSNPHETPSHAKLSHEFAFRHSLLRRPRFTLSFRESRGSKFPYEFSAIPTPLPPANLQTFPVPDTISRLPFPSPPPPPPPIASSLKFSYLATLPISPFRQAATTPPHPFHPRKTRPP